MKRTGAVVTVCVLLLLAWEAWALCNGIPDDTISQLVWTASDGRPYIPFAAGLLEGHFFWPRKVAK